MIPKRPTRATAALVALLALALGAVCHLHLHRYYLDRLDTDHTLYPGARPGADPAPPPALARRVWVVLLDGLRPDTADALPTVRSLGARGVRRTVIAEVPSFTYPNVMAMATGVPPLYSGVRLNTGRVRAHFDTVFDAARRSGRDAVIAPLGVNVFDATVASAGSARVVHLSLEELTARPARPEIAWVYFPDVDDAGHSDGVDSRAYRGAARRADALLARLAAALDPRVDALVAVSDHGHLARGGHGGDEPEVLRAFFLAYGAGVREGARLGPRPMRDLASTVTMLAGLAPPRDNLGVPMVDLLASSAGERARALAPAWLSRSRADEALGDRVPTARRDDVYSALARGDGAALAPALATLDALERARDARFWRGARDRARWRLLLALAFAAAVLLGMARARATGALVVRARDLAPALAYAAFFAGFYAAAGYGWTWSIPRGQLSFVVETAVCGLAGAAAALTVGRTRWAREGGASRAVEQASVVAWLWVLYAFAAAAVGTDPVWLASAATSFGMILVSTSVFYLAVALGIAALVVAVRRAPAA